MNYCTEYDIADRVYGFMRKQYTNPTIKPYVIELKNGWGEIVFVLHYKWPKDYTQQVTYKIWLGGRDKSIVQKIVQQALENEFTWHSVFENDPYECRLKC